MSAELRVRSLTEGTSGRTRPLGFRDLYDRHFELVYQLLARYGVRTCDLEDLAQRVFMVVHDRAAELGGVEQPQAWLRAITVRVVHEYYRWYRVRRAHAWLVEHSWAGHRVEQRTPEDAAGDTEALGRLELALRRMSPKLRDALVLTELEELPLREAAGILRIPVNTLRSRQALARAELHRLWQKSEAKGNRQHG